MARLLNGKMVAEALNQKAMSRIQLLKDRGVAPGLAIVRCGEKPADLSYERSVMLRAEAVGVRVFRYILARDVTRQALTDQIQALNEDPSVHGVLLFRPLPVHLKDYQTQICNTLIPSKDVDCMTDLSCAGVYEGRNDLGFPPCTAQACMEILDAYGIDVCGKKVAVIGRSLVVGRPAAMMLMHKNATVAICHTRTKDVADIARRSDIVVTAAGKLNSLTRSHVREGQVIIDVSMNWDDQKRNAKGSLGAFSGDTAFDEVEPVVDAITPVPGGVGAVTTSVLISHVVEAAERALIGLHQ